MIYLDNAATTKIDPEVLEVMKPYINEEYGNAGTKYQLGRNAAQAIQKARQQVADLINCSPEQIVFTSGGCEANSLVFYGLRQHLINEGKKHIITSSVEHDSILKCAHNLCIKDEFYISYTGVDKVGTVNIQEIKNSITEGTGLVSIMHMNNETGTENPIEEIGMICSHKKVLFHTDCVQSLGSCKIDVREIGCDFLTLSSHKIHGAKGVGALYVRDISLLNSIIEGGNAQEFGLRGGTENVAGIVGFGKACEILYHKQNDFDLHTSILKQSFFAELTNKLNEYNLSHIIHLNGDSVIKHGKIINIRFDGIDGETLLLALDNANICVSSGSACSSNKSEASHVLQAMGLSEEEARSSIRISFSRMNTKDDVEKAASLIADCVRFLYKN